MTLDWRQQLLTPYERQVDDIPPARRLCIGPNDPDNWTAGEASFDVLAMMARFAYPLGSPAGQVLGASGKFIEYEKPLLLQSEFNASLTDWTMADYDRLEEWRVTGEKLRLWSWGMWVAVGTIRKIVDERPYPATLAVTFSLLGLRKYLASAIDVTVTLVNGRHGPLVDTPFNMTAPDGTAWVLNTALHGNEIMDWDDDEDDDG